MTLSKLEDLRAATDITLAELTADASMKYRILEKARSTQAENVKGNGTVFHLIPLFCSLLALVLILSISLNSVHQVSPVVPGDINIFAAGATNERSLFPEGFKMESVVSISVDDEMIISDPDTIASLSRFLTSDVVIADVEETSSLSPDAYLSFKTRSGDVFVFGICEPYIIGNQIWSCRTFFEALRSLAAE